MESIRMKFFMVNASKLGDAFSGSKELDIPCSISELSPFTKGVEGAVDAFLRLDWSPPKLGA
jgi:hypothetical protein